MSGDPNSIKPAKKLSKPFQAAIIAATASSRFRKRQVSEGSTSSNHGGLPPQSVGFSNATPAKVEERVSSRPTIHNYEGSTATFETENTTSYNSLEHVRLVRPWQSADRRLAEDTAGVDATTMSAPWEPPQPFVKSLDFGTPRSSTPAATSYDQIGSTPPSSRPTTPNPTTSRGHWNQLRNAIIHNSTMNAPPVPPVVGLTQISTVPPPRPQTPKPSRLARLGFRQVVEQSREMIHGETSRFEADIHQACAVARFGEIRQKPERDGSQGGYLPFMSTTSLPLSVTSAGSQPGKSGLTQPNDGIGRSPPSLKLLHQTLIRYTSLSGPGEPITTLPYESEILSVLIVPFTANFGQRGTDERWLAVEIFELAAKTWQAPTPQREIDRALWCCKAALIPTSPVRSRVLGSLSNILFSSKPLKDGNPLSFQNLVQGLLLLLHTFSKEREKSHEDVKVAREILVHVISGACGELNQQEIETEYEGLWGLRDNEESVRNQIVLEGVVQCMQNGSEALRRWALQELVEEYWQPPSESLSPLCRKIRARRLNGFLRASLSLLNLDAVQVPPHFSVGDANAVIRLLHRALPELEQFPVPKHSSDGRALVVELAMELLSIQLQDAQKQQMIALVCGWCENHGGWQQSLQAGLVIFIEKAEWLRLTKILQEVVNEIPEDGRKTLIPVIISALHTRLVTDPAPFPLPGLTSLLRTLARLYPQQFYKPLFSLAGASKDLTLVGQLGIVTMLARHLPEFWISDSEMMSVALMSEIGSTFRKEQSKPGENVIWGRTRIGQSLIMVELVRFVKQLIKEKKDKSSPPDASQAQAHRFFTTLEARLAILLDAKEKTLLVPFSQRILFSMLFLEIRLFNRSLKPAPWLQKIVTWATQSYMGARLHLEPDSFSSRDEISVPHVNDDAFDEVLSTASKIQSIHVACWQAPPANTRQHSMVVVPPTFDSRNSVAESIDHPEANAKALKEVEELIASLSAGVTSATLRLLVAMCALITQNDHRVIGPILWSRFLEDEDPRIVAPACFLFTHCLEKNPKDIAALIEQDMRSTNSVKKLTMIRRAMTLFAWRSQLLSQTYLYDRARSRPFRMVRQPISFVAIDAGSSNYVHEQTEEDGKSLAGGGTLPMELRKRLAEVGWEQEDQPTDTRLERARAPMSLFPISELENPGQSSRQDAMTTTRSTEKIKHLLRRKSSTSGRHAGAKRRPVFVPALVSVFSSMAALTIDLDPIVANTAREAMLLMLRDDPVMLCRPAMDMFSTDLRQVSTAISILRMFFHTHHRLPPSASHHIFTHLGGFLKHISRDSHDPGSLRAFSQTAPLLARLITQVSSLTIRDLRRAKFEIYVFPSGSLCFPPSAPLSAMFPQSLGPVTNPFDEMPFQLTSIFMIRTAQNMLLFNMLKHKPQELHTIRKGLTRLILPGQDSDKELDMIKFLPQRPSIGTSRRAVYWRVSLAFSRSHLLLLAQIFRSMSRNFNGRAELAQLFDGLNRILLEHGDDLGIVSHALIACMVAVTRFKRLVSSGGGFALFMPGLLKVYAEAEAHAGIRQAIQYASSRFYAIHQEAYVFQSLDLASHILSQIELSEDQAWLAKNIYELFASLKYPLQRSTPDAAGIQGSNMGEEREALIATTISDETPRAGSQDSLRGEQLKKILATGQYENMVLNLDDFVRLLLTVIAHDPTIIRAQNFLALLRYMAPEFYNGSGSARGVLRDGINALGSALFAKSPRQRMQETIPGRPLQKTNIGISSYGSDDGAANRFDPSAPCDHIFVRREYLKLIVAYSRMGGDLRHGTIRHALDVVKSLLKDPGRNSPESEGIFLHDFTNASLSRLSVTSKQAVALLSDIAPVVKAFALSMDCSGVLDTVTELMKRPELENDVSFIQLVVDQIAGPVLDACNEAASENMLLSLSMRPSVVALLSWAAALPNADVLSYIEKQPPSAGFLAGIVLPLCLSMKTSTEFVTELRRQDRLVKHGLIFVRLLVYVMEACYPVIEGDTGRSSPLPGLNRRDSQRSKHSSVSSSRAQLATLILAVQIIKVIVVRAADDLSRGLVGIWTRLASFLQHLLDDGNALFGLPFGQSPAPSPSYSPMLNPSPHTPSSDGHDPSSPVGSAPRVVDYLTWSLLEHLCYAPSPLTLQMRLWMQEKVHSLDAELKTRETLSPLAVHSHRRLSSSVFVRPRGSSTSPEALRASHGLSSAPSDLNLSGPGSTDFAAYSRFSSRSSMQASRSRPTIIHLGPTTDPNVFHPVDRSSSQDSDLKCLARTSHIGSRTLVKLTYNRVRLVQTYMGYDRLLPMEGQTGDPNNLDFKAWTKASTLAALVAETKGLMDEFPENFYENIGGDFVDVPSGSEIRSTQTSPVKSLGIRGR